MVKTLHERIAEKVMQKIRRNRTREVKSFVSFVKVYRRPYPHHRTSNSCSRTLIVWKQSLGSRSTDLGPLGMVPDEDAVCLTDAPLPMELHEYCQFTYKRFTVNAHKCFSVCFTVSRNLRVMKWRCIYVSGNFNDWKYTPPCVGHRPHIRICSCTDTQIRWNGC